nr:hypothetical protein [Tanacetum cinerariifolium]
CGGGVAADSSVSNGSVSSADRAWSAAVGVKHPQHMVGPQHRSHRQHALELEHNLVKMVPTLAPRGQVYNLERVVPEERPLHMGPL